MVETTIPLGTQLAVMTKLYHGALVKRLEHLEIDRYFGLVLFLGKSTMPLTQQKLSEELLIDKTAMVRVVDYLTEKGYVKRVVNAQDRREYFIHLTENGKTKLQDIEKAITELNSKVFKEFTREEEKTFLNHLRQINKNLSMEPAMEYEMNFKKNKNSK